MKVRLFQRWDEARASYWFLPTLMALGALALAVVLPALDARLGPGLFRGVWLYTDTPEAAQALLSTVAGSMIGVAGVAFSITIAAVVYAAGQYGPRLLTNFMGDTGNQVTLGTFVAAFVYCLLVLQTVRGADEAAGRAAFVPHLSVLVALGFALAGLGVLIYFVHHVPESIQVSSVIARIGRDLDRHIGGLFPAGLGHERADEAETVDRTGDGRAPAEAALPEDFHAAAAVVRCDGAGYVQRLDEGALLETAVRHDLVLRLEYRPGDFVSEGKTLLWAWPAERVDAEVHDDLQGAYAWGKRRTPVQDVRFLADELVEIATRALSPAVNDPFTAMNCLDWLGAALARLAGGRAPSPLRHDEAGRLRVVAQPSTFAAFAEAVFGALRPYVRADRNAALHCLRTIAEASERAGGAERAVLRQHADRLLEGCEAALGQETDRREVRERHAAVVRVLAGEAPYAAVAAEAPWLGGSA